MRKGRTNEKPDGTSLQTHRGFNRRDLLLGGTSAVAASALGATSLPKVAQAQEARPRGDTMTTEQLDRSKLPMPEPAFGGKIGKTYQDSKADWPKLPTHPASSSSCSTMSALGRSRRSAGPSRRRILTTWQPAGSDTPVFTRPPSAVRRARHLLRVATTTTLVWDSSRNGQRASLATTT